MTWTKNAHFLILNGKDNSAKMKGHYELAFQSWHRVWEDVFSNELNLKKDLYSDGFIRQDEVGTLFYEGQCVGVVFFNYMDMSLIAHRKDSYFAKWSNQAIEGLTKYGDNIIVCSNFTIDFEYRKKIGGIKWKDILMGLLVEHFRHSKQSAMTGTMRVQKGMHDCTYKVGARSLARGVNFSSSSDKVDLVAFYQNSILPPLTQVEEIFNNSLSFIGKEKKYAVSA